MYIYCKTFSIQKKIRTKSCDRSFVVMAPSLLNELHEEIFKWLLSQNMLNYTFFVLIVQYLMASCSTLWFWPFLHISKETILYVFQLKKTNTHQKYRN